MPKTPNPFDRDWTRVSPFIVPSEPEVVPGKGLGSPQEPSEKPTGARKPSTLSEAAKGSLDASSEVVFSFDTTGSMYPCLEAVRAEIGKTCSELFALFPGLRIGLISHGDYCDGQLRINSLPLTNDSEAVKKFIRDTPRTGGGDSPECYELALATARAPQMGWSADANKMLVIVGDNEPHSPDYPGNDEHLDWRQELVALNAKGIKTFPMQCLYYPQRTQVNAFWEELAKWAGTDLIQFAAGQNFTDFATPMFAGKIASAGGSAGYERYCASPVGMVNNSKLSGQARSSNKMSAEKYDAPVVTWETSTSPEDKKE